jgi:hypothetical protein
MLTMLSAIAALTAASEVGYSSNLQLIAVENHHIIELNSDQPYVAGYHVNTKDLGTRENVNATAVTVSFPLTDTSFFPSGSWLGGGMFVQAQDSRFRHVDYGFYMMLVLDASGNLFVDLGLHQTREGTLPLQMPTEEVVYAYTWRLVGADYATAVALQAIWNSSGFVHYSIIVSGVGFNLASVNVAALPNCENIIRRFYAGNAVVEPFPFSRYVNFFQFGAISSEPMNNNRWSVSIREPKVLRQTGWVMVDRAWVTQGDISYLDWDWRWGGTPYTGVDVEYYGNQPISYPHEIIFFFNGHTASPGTVLWDTASLRGDYAENARPFCHDSALGTGEMPPSLAVMMSLTLVALLANVSSKLAKHSTNPRRQIEH